MSDNHDNKILIKFEIHVPVGAGSAPVVINPPDAAAPAAAAPAAAPADQTPPVAAPPAPGPPAPGPAPQIAIHSAKRLIPTVMNSLTSVSLPSLVKVPGSSTTGEICVQAQQDSDPACGAPLEVWVAVHPPGADIPATPPTTTATQATPVPAGGSFFNWKADPVPGAQCEWPASGTGVTHGARNELIIWRRYSGEAHWSIEVIIFRGLCNNTATDCTYFALPTAQLAAQRLDTIPAALEVAARGFGGALARLNQTFRLTHLDSPAPGVVQWASAGDGDKVARAVLTCRTSGDVCELLLEVDCKRIIYRLPAAGFQPLSANRLVWSGLRDGLDNSKFPTEVPVIPAQ